jgi:hypothetical protein
MTRRWSSARAAYPRFERLAGTWDQPKQDRVRDYL